MLCRGCTVLTLNFKDTKSQLHRIELTLYKEQYDGAQLDQGQQIS